MDQIRVVRADLTDEGHRAAVRKLTDAYARDAMGQGRPLPDDVLERLPDALAAHPAAVIFLAYQGEEAVGIANCFVGFSTFAAKPLLNIHDLGVVPDWRGAGIGRALLEAVEAYARGNGFCKLTLEASENNPARRLYVRFGFHESSIFYTKALG